VGSGVKTLKRKIDTSICPHSDLKAFSSPIQDSLYMLWKNIDGISENHIYQNINLFYDLCLPTEFRDINIKLKNEGKEANKILEELSNKNNQLKLEITQLKKNEEDCKNTKIELVAKVEEHKKKAEELALKVEELNANQVTLESYKQQVQTLTFAASES
jgi:hypothetical protein